MPKLRRTREARTDVGSIWRHIAADDLAAAERWLANIDQKAKLLSEFPGLGVKRDELSPLLRSYPVGSYLIFYRAIPGGIEVLRVLHGARDLRRLFKR